VFAVAAAEVAVGLALFIAIYRRRNTIAADEIDLLKW
jgi:NADH:ubiquinone oxidoreductase subunit K